MRYLFLNLLVSLSFFNSNAQNQQDIKELIIESNESYSASIELIITAGDQSQKLKGDFTMNKEFQYMSLESAEFFTFNKKQIKVSNEEKKLAVYNTGVASMSDFLFNKEDFINFHFPAQVKETEGEYQLVLIPIDNMKNLIGKTTITMDRDYKIQSVIYKMPSSNPFGIDVLTINYLDRIDQVDMTKSPDQFFKFKDDQLTILNTYTNYTLMQ